MSNTIRLPHCTTGESEMANRVVGALLARGWLLSVFDGAEYTVKRSADRHEILRAMNTTSEDVLVVRDAEGNRLGSVSLVYGNADDGSELISDYTATDLLDAVLDPLIG